MCHDCTRGHQGTAGTHCRGIISPLRKLLRRASIFTGLVLCVAVAIPYFAREARQPRTVDDVRAWFASLPANATDSDVCNVLDARGVEWARAPAMVSQPGDQSGIYSEVQPSLGDDRFSIEVHVAKDGHVRMISVECQWLE